MTEQPVVGRIASFDPLQQDEGDFIASFVARERELQLLLRFVAEAQTQVLTNHPLVYGSRGMGKTTLLRRLALAVRDHAVHSEQWIPITFREEQYNVTRIDDFYINCADGLANWCEQNSDQKSAAELDDAIDRRDQLQACLGAVAKRHKRRLLLLVDNIQYIFSALKQPSDHWQLREWLQQRNGPLMIAATPIVIEQLGNRDAPFYDFFQLVNLKPLSAVDLRQCLLKVALSRGAAGTSVVAELKKHPQRIVTLHTLCGGNPRTLSLIYQVLENLCREDGADSGSVFADLLEGTLEKTTPLYKARTEELSDQQRPILDAIALHWDPIHSSTISQRTAVAPSALSSQLKRLTTDGVIDRVKLGEKKYGYQLGERFYNIWYLMRHGSRRNRERLRWLIQFLNSYYTPAELNRQARQQLGADPKRTPFTESLMYAIDDTSLSSALRQHLTLPLIDSNADVIRCLTPDEDYSASILDHHQRRQKIVDKLLAMGRSVEQSSHFADQVSASMSLEARVKQIISETELSSLQIDGLTSVFTAEEAKLRELIGDTFYNSITTLFANGMITGINDEAGIAAAVAGSNNLGQIIVLLSVCSQGRGLSSQHLQLLEETLSIHLPVNDGAEAVEPGYSELDSIACYFLGNLLADQLQRYDEAEQAYKKAIEVDPGYAYPWNGLGNLLADQLQRYDEAERAYKKAIKVDPGFAYPWNGLGNLLADQLERYEEAEQAYKKAIEVDPGATYPWNGLGNLLKNQLERYDEAEQAYKKAIEVDPGFASPWNGLGNLLADQLERYDEAEQAYKKAIEVDPGFASPWNGLGNLLADQLQRYDEAEQVYKKAIDVDPDYALPWNNLGNLLADQLERYDEAEQAYKKAIEVDPGYAYPWNGLGNLLSDQLQRFDEAEQAYKKAIEIDPGLAYPWYGLGSLLADHLERYDEAEQAYKKAIEVDPGFASPWNGLGNLLKNQLQRYDEAEQVYKKAIEVDPNYAGPWTGLGNLMQDHKNQFTEAVDCYAAAAKIANPDSMQFVNGNRVWLALAKGDEQQYQRYRQSLSLPEPGLSLIEAGKLIIDGNPGAACGTLQSIFEENEPTLWINFNDDLLRLTRLIKQNGFGDFYLGWIREQRLDHKLSPYTAAVEAYFVDPDALLRLNPEARGVAIRLYHWLISKPADNA